MFGEIVHNIHGAGTGDLFPAGEGEVDVVLRHKAAADKFFRGGEDAVEGVFRVQRAASPDHAVFQDRLKRRLFPVLFLDRDDVVMRHQHCGLPAAVRPLPPEEEASVVEAEKRARLPYVRIELRQKRNEFVKFRVVLKAPVFPGDRFAAHKFPEGLHRRLLIKGDLLLLPRLFGERLKKERPDDKHRKEEDNQGKYDPSNHDQIFPFL